ncbi:L,D-transpeptidase [Streptomyces daliensis]|uniref:L,D-transpeptidase family protein n=1 Tax=Streptomyces daliensis TaxID=299421 RepID=A0A8T4ITQ9_9ACTN|nr:L,D-transpeptidase family protein [Streptomyces daliensis]
MDLKAIARGKLSLEAIPGERRAQVIGGSAAGLAVLVVVLLLVLTTCGGGSGDAGADQQVGKEASETPSKAVVSIAPKDGADGVATNDALKVTAAKGKLTKVEVADSKGEPVKGEIAEDGTSWEPDSHLTTDTKYTVDAVARDSEGRETTERSTFTTLTPKNKFIGHFTPDDGDKVGAGMPVSINFDRAIKDRDAVEEAISVTAEPEVDVEGHWFGDQRLDFRPEEYWAAGTKVTLELDLNGVESADGVYGTQKKSVEFTVGRKQVSVVDAKKKTMTVTRDGKKIKTLPITSGSPSNPTYNGKMVISERLKVTRMDGRTVGFGRDEGSGGYDIKDVPHAMRLSTSGTFIHGNYWTAQSQFGQANLSHGCVGLFDAKGGGDPGTPGAWFFNHSIVGDVVEIKNSKDETIQPDNGLNGWNMDWDKWTAEQ